MNAKTFGGKDLLTVGETWGATPEIAKQYSDPKRNELSMVFQFEHVGLDEEPGKSKWDIRPLQIAELKEVFAKWQTELGDQGWNSLFWNNHDLPRIVSRWGNDKAYRVQSAKMLAILLHMLKGTPYIYQGEEIGMTNRVIHDITEVEDIESKNMYADRIQKGYGKKDMLASINVKGRDNARTPMQWDNSENAGFTTGTPWLAVNENYDKINVEQALADNESIFYTYQKLIHLRKNYPLIVWGSFELLEETATDIFAYYRHYQGVTWLVVCNFSDQEQVFSLEKTATETILSNTEKDYSQLVDRILEPYEAFVVAIAN